MSVNHLKNKLRKRKTSAQYTNILDKRLLSALKETDQLYVYGAGLTKKHKN